jgi:hypothetical protein
MIATELTQDEATIINQADTTTVVVTALDAVPAIVKSGDMALVHVQDQTATVLLGESAIDDGGGSGSPSVSALGDLSNVTEVEKSDGALLEFDLAGGQWRPTTMQRNQIYDGGNF